MKLKMRKGVIIGGVALILALIVAIVLIIVLSKEKPLETVEISFNSNGGSSVNSLLVVKGEEAQKPEEPTREGYNFLGWYYNDEEFDFTQKIEENIVLEARWEEIIIEKIELESETLSMLMGDEKTIEIVSLPEGYTKSDVEYFTSDRSVVTITAKGEMKAIRNGEATISVRTKDAKFMSTCLVTVTKNTVDVKSIKISGPTEVKVGEKIKLTATISPSNATDKSVLWVSGAESIATIDQNGNVTGRKAGTVRITATTGLKTDTYDIKVVDPNAPDKVSVESVSIGSNIEMEVGEMKTLQVTITPSNATNKNVTFKSDKEAVAKVSSTGQITAVGAGEANITVTTEDGNKTSSIKVTVKEATPQATYVFHIKSLGDEIAGGTVQYQCRVTKDGETFSDYQELTYNNRSYTPSSFTQNVSFDALPTNPFGNAKIKLNDGSSVDASVVYE